MTPEKRAIEIIKDWGDSSCGELMIVIAKSLHEVVEAEREACAQIAEVPGYIAHPIRGHPMASIEPSPQIAAAIRNRK